MMGSVFCERLVQIRKLERQITIRRKIAKATQGCLGNKEFVLGQDIIKRPNVAKTANLVKTDN